MKKTILTTFGTRPEAIKFAPLIKVLGNKPDYEVKVCITSQHKEMLQQVLSFFDIKPDVDLDVMRPDQNLATLTSRILELLTPVIRHIKPDLVMVQGDTTTAFAAALAAYYEKVPVAHLEAGLRSGQLYAPFPEEVNRKLVGSIAGLHFAPTVKAQQNLFAENIREHVYVTGNTVIDALHMGLRLLDERKTDFSNIFSFIDPDKKIILVTGHRRESFGEGFAQICTALHRLATTFPHVQVVYPVHLNPRVQEPVYRMLKDIPNVFLMPPVNYEQMIWLMRRSYIVLTDSGGIQEEAPSLGKPVVVMREVTERVEGVEAGTAVLAGTDVEKITSITSELLTNEALYNKMASSINPYGNGTSSLQIAAILQQYFHEQA